MNEWNPIVVDDVAQALASYLESHLEPDDTFFVSGGSTGPTLFAEMTETTGFAQLVSDIGIAQVDERVVPQGHADSNFSHLQSLLLDPLLRQGISPRWVLPMVELTDLQSTGTFHDEQVTESELTQMADRYQDRIRDLLSTSVMHLGIGEDGHTASLFEGSRAVEETGRLVCWNQDPSGHNIHFRLTLSYAALARAKSSVMCVAGRSKAKVLRELCDGKEMPAQRLDATHTTLICDAEAASLI